MGGGRVQVNGVAAYFSDSYKHTHDLIPPLAALYNLDIPRDGHPTCLDARP
jgi:hypothetical protein